MGYSDGTVDFKEQKCISTEDNVDIGKKQSTKWNNSRIEKENQEQDKWIEELEKENIRINK